MSQLTMTPFTLKMSCIVEDCGNRHIARGYCPKHYYHARKSGFTEPGPLARTPTGRPTNFCTVEGCDERVKGHGLCGRHYQLWRMRGKNPDDLTNGSLLVKKPAAKPWLGVKGEAAPAWKGDAAATYRQTHKRVTAAKGPAQDHLCVDCGAQAKQWSYIGGAPDERSEPRRDDPTKLIRYSVKTDFYQPRCTPCHKAFDRRK